MEVCTILPVPLQDIEKDNNYFIALWQVLKDNPSYMKFMKDRLAEGKFVFMDNGAAEGENPTWQELIPIIKELHPMEVILPDVPCDYLETVTQTREAYMGLQDADIPQDVMFFAVPQGATFDEWLACMTEFIRQPNIVTLGVSKFVTPQFQKEFPGENVRMKCVEAIVSEMQAINRPEIGIHLLGCWEDAEEIGEIEKEFSLFVRGCDSALAYVYTRNGIKLEKGSKRPDNKEIDFHNGDIDNRELLSDNIKSWVETCRGN